jgi:hypothetical protein
MQRYQPDQGSWELYDADAGVLARVAETAICSSSLQSRIRHDDAWPCCWRQNQTGDDFMTCRRPSLGISRWSSVFSRALQSLGPRWHAVAEGRLSSTARKSSMEPRPAKLPLALTATESLHNLSIGAEEVQRWRLSDAPRSRWVKAQRHSPRAQGIRTGYRVQGRRASRQTWGEYQWGARQTIAIN